MKDWRSWKFKNLTLLFLSFILAYVVGSFNPLREFLFDTGLVAAFFAGAVFVFAFTAPLAAAVLLILCQKFPLIQVGLIASLGAVISDFTIFRFIKDGISEELEPIYENVKIGHLKRAFRIKKYRWLSPIIGALLIFTPLPHNVGMGMIGSSKLKGYKFLALSLITNIVGIFFVVFLSLIINA